MWCRHGALRVVKADLKTWRMEFGRVKQNPTRKYAIVLSSRGESRWCMTIRQSAPRHAGPCRRITASAIKPHSSLPYPATTLPRPAPAPPLSTFSSRHRRCPPVSIGAVRVETRPAFFYAVLVRLLTSIRGRNGGNPGPHGGAPPLPVTVRGSRAGQGRGGGRGGGGGRPE